MNSNPGTYALVLKSNTTTTIQIGRWGYLKINPGYYIYIGSAFGPGGVSSRVSRHCRLSKSKHWHIDYLREFTKPLFAFYSDEPVRLEHEWANALNNVKGISSISGFGCSDCHCESHLFFTAKKPELSEFVQVVGSDVKTWKCEKEG